MFSKIIKYLNNLTKNQKYDENVNTKGTTSSN
jgi:hypothetical protein